MNMIELRQRLNQTAFIRKAAPAFLGTMLFVGSSCSNVREFAARSTQSGPSARAVETAADGGVQHAYTAHNNDANFVDLLEHKMRASEGNQRVSSNNSEGAPAPSVQELLAAGKDPFLSEEPSRSSAMPSDQRVTPVSSERIESFEQSIPASTSTRDNETPARPRPFVDPQFELTSATQVQSAPIEHASALQVQEDLTENRVLFEADPRVVLDGDAACPPVVGDPSNHACPPFAAGSPFGMYSPVQAPPQPFAGANPTLKPEMYGDEYIHDGGDRGTKVYYNDYARFGLDVEDTVAEWHDDAGVAHVKPSTRASIYAPKFAAVRSATLPHMDVKIDKLAGHQDLQQIAGIDTKLVIDEKVRTDEAVAMRLRTRSSGIDAKATDTSLHQNVATQHHVKLMNVYEDFRFFREGQLGLVNKAVIGDAIASALDWNGDLGVIIYGHDLSGQEVQGRFTVQDYTAVEDRSKPGDLEIVKVVDKTVAKPGEILTFTIRFDNTGDRSLSNIRIVDNLSPRLKYIDGSVDSSLDGKLETEDNSQGSQILNFTFEAPLKGHTGGWVSFKCQVR